MMMSDFIFVVVLFFLLRRTRTILRPQTSIQPIRHRVSFE